ncbi:TauD/TfdA family dioxygenase [Chitinimonas lacunae]|uniref:TauD/TfdA family dioxygenase n=1 Tax=Chitinimonas lacunae TaxID=1963018 RepID=A0ABV8MU93_9NEIS
MSTTLSSPSELPVITSVEGWSRTDLLGALAEHGVLLLRDCLPDAAAFAAFVRRHSSRLSLDPARSLEGGVAQLVDAGTAAVGLHCENGNSPFWPDLTWFFCEIPASQGSQTTVCDGEQVLAHLSDGCRRFFEEQPIRYARRVPADKWKRLVCHYQPDLSDLSRVRFEHLQALVNDDPHTALSFDPTDESIGYAFTVSAIQVSKISRRPAFANSMLGPSYNYEAPRITRADGSPIPAELLAEFERISAALTHEIPWQARDMVMLDNRRVMHGRRAILDTRRRIYNALSYL